MARETYSLKKLPNGAYELVPRSELSAWLERHYPDRHKGTVIEMRKIERGSWVWRDGKLVDRNLALPRMNRGRGLQVIKDLEPYQNIAVDGKVVGGRRQHRDMLRAHSLIEVGTEPHNKTKPPEYFDSPKHQREVVDALKRTMGKL